MTKRLKQNRPMTGKKIDTDGKKIDTENFP